jgi:glycosyltransferase involved in cell wall biosynthesis
MVTLVIPCFNEADRLRPDAFASALDYQRWLSLVLVDDGSADATRQILERLASSYSNRAFVLSLARNSGKAEAVRQGLLRAFDLNAELVGFWDADLATPLDAVPDFLRVFEHQPRIEVVIGSRVRLLGRDIRRSAVRHYTGRVFATAASHVLGIPVYDTQCGAKIFRNSARLHRIIASPFSSRWIFDVELLGRYLDDRAGDATDRPGVDRIYELALRSWVDEPGSKIRAKDGVRAASDLLRIYRCRSRGGTLGGPIDAARDPIEASVSNRLRTDRSIRS